MINELGKFLESHEGEYIWIAIPSGVIYGDVVSLEEPLEYVRLTDARLVGRHAINLGSACVRLDQIAAWGEGSPVVEED